MTGSTTVDVTCDKNNLFANGDALPMCLRVATHVIEATQGGRTVTAYACDPCVAMIRLKRSLATLDIRPLRSSS
jgi:hypothetical protein